LWGRVRGDMGLPETAATDPYTRCGFRKVICISATGRFSHSSLPNRYIGGMGTPLPRIKEQVQTLMGICNGTHPAITLCEVESKLIHGRWSKRYDEKPCPELLAMVPQGVRTVLSIGCGSGATEGNLKQRGAKITVLPLDSVIGAASAHLGLEVIYGTMEECFNRLGERTSTAF